MLTLGSLLLAAPEHEAVSWVPYQIGCPLLMTDLRVESDAPTPGLLSIDVQNVSTDAIEEITVGLARRRTAAALGCRADARRPHGARRAATA